MTRQQPNRWPYVATWRPAGMRPGPRVTLRRPSPPRRSASTRASHLATRARARRGAFQTRGAAALPEDLREELAAFRAGLEADQGGAAELTTIRDGYIRRLTELEGCLLLLAADLQARGLLTVRGRVRSTYDKLLATIDRWDRLAQRLGLSRRTRRVPTLAEYLEQRAEPAPEPVDASVLANDAEPVSPDDRATAGLRAAEDAE